MTNIFRCEGGEVVNRLTTHTWGFFSSVLLLAIKSRPSVDWKRTDRRRLPPIRTRQNTQCGELSRLLRGFSSARSSSGGERLSRGHGRRWPSPFAGSRSRAPLARHRLSRRHRCCPRPASVRFHDETICSAPAPDVPFTKRGLVAFLLARKGGFIFFL